MLSTTDDVRRVAFDLVFDAARRADNIGTDEVPTVEYLEELLFYADDAIALYDDFANLERGMNGGKMGGLLIILPNLHPSNCTMMIVTG